MANTMSESDVPFFLYYSPTTPHVPWTPGTEINGVPTGGVSSAGPRGDEVVQFDAIVGHLIAKLRSLGIMDNTLLIVTSDNGPHLNGDPSGNTFGHDSTGGLRGRKLDVWEGGHRVPFIAHWGGGTPDGFVIPPGLVSDEVIGLQDLMATVADLTHFELPTDAAEDSESILSELLGDKSDGRIRNALLHQAERGRGGYAVRDGEWKLILQHTPQHIGLFATGLYNIVDDPTETTNIISQHPQIVTRMVGIVGQYREMGASARRLIGIPTPNAAEGGVVLLSMGAIHVGVFLVRQHRRSSPRTK